MILVNRDGVQYLLVWNLGARWLCDLDSDCGDFGKASLFPTLK